MNISIENLDRIYRLQTEAQLRIIRIGEPDFRRFSSDLEKFCHAVSRFRDRQFVGQSISILRRYRFAMTAAPLGFDNPSVLGGDALERLEDSKSVYIESLPKLADGFSRLVDQAKVLVRKDSNPYLQEIVHIARTGPVAALVSETRFIPLVEAILGNAPGGDGIKVISEQQLRRNNDRLEALVCFGARTWYPVFIFRSPRARVTSLLTFDWIRGQESPIYPALAGSDRVREFHRVSLITSTAGSQRREENRPKGESLREVELIDPQNLAPQIDLQETGREYSVSDGKTDDRVIAQLFQLEGGKGVFLESTEKSSVLIIDPDESDGKMVRRKVVKDIDPGVVVLLRADYDDSGSDYIKPIADKILGERAENLRKVQKLWKSKLREAVRLYGSGEVVELLRKNGCLKANESNLVNWQSERNIRTEARRDFAAIMSLIGLPADADKLWKLSGMIDRAHRQAGRLVRRILLEKVRAADLEPLNKLGRMTFELDEIGARPLIAIRVTGSSEESVHVTHGYLNRIIDLTRNYY